MELYGFMQRLQAGNSQFAIIQFCGFEKQFLCTFNMKKLIRSYVLKWTRVYFKMIQHVKCIIQLTEKKHIIPFQNSYRNGERGIWKHSKLSEIDICVRDICLQWFRTVYVNPNDCWRSLLSGLSSLFFCFTRKIEFNPETRSFYSNTLCALIQQRLSTFVFKHKSKW